MQETLNSTYELTYLGRHVATYEGTPESYDIARDRIEELRTSGQITERAATGCLAKLQIYREGVLKKAKTHRKVKHVRTNDRTTQGIRHLQNRVA